MAGNAGRREILSTINRRYFITGVVTNNANSFTAHTACRNQIVPKNKTNIKIVNSSKIVLYTVTHFYSLFTHQYDAINVYSHDTTNLFICFRFSSFYISKKKICRSISRDRDREQAARSLCDSQSSTRRNNT